MKEALVIVIILLVVLALTAVRYRRQLMTGVHVWRTIRKMRQGVRTQQAPEQIKRPNDVALVNCAKCGTWVTQADAIRLGSKSYFCSRNCVESFRGDLG